MVRTDTLPINSKALNYEFSRTPISVGILSELTNLDPKTIKSALSGKSVSAKVIRKLAYFFKVPASFFSDDISDELLELTKVDSWQNFIKNAKLCDDFDPNIDIDLDQLDSKEHIEIIEEFIKTLTEYINSFKNSNEINFSSEINIADKLAQTRSIKMAIQLAEIAREIEVFAKVHYGNQLFWQLYTDSIDMYGYLTYEVTNKLIIEISNNSSPIYYTAPVGEIPLNPAKQINSGQADFRVTFLNSYLSSDKYYFKNEFEDWSKNYDK